MMYYHHPVLLKESIEGLDIKISGTYVDVTYGGGGHSREILKRIKNGCLIGVDCDEDTVKNTIKDKRFTYIRGNFRFLKNYLRYYKINNVDGIIADLGVSSHFIDSAGRGFSYKNDGILDMRMNKKSGSMAKDLLNNYSARQLTGIFREYGELKNASGLVREIIASREQRPIERTGEFITAISGCIPKYKENQYLAKVFQALRIEVNNEIDNLKELLLQALDLINKKGRLVVISYHSLEDRLVKNFIRWGNFDEGVSKDIYGDFSTPFRAVNKKIIVPGQEEVRNNSRARSARLRIAEKN